MKVLIRVFPLIIFWGTFIGVILFLPYPDSLPQASFLQMIAFFIPLFLAITFTVDLVLKNIPSSIAFSLGIILLLALKALKSVNSLYIILIVLAVGLLVSYFKSMRSPLTRSGSNDLTSSSFVPKLKNLRRKK